MPGWLTNGVSQVTALVNTGTTVSPVPLTNLTSQCLIPVDTAGTAGAEPITVAATPAQIAAFATQLIYNSATSTAGAATLARNGGVILTEALTTAIGSHYTMTVTNSLVAVADPPIQVQIHGVTATAGQMQVDSVTNAAGSFVAIFTNVGTAAVNGTMAIAFHR
jgi:hypothetical protein